MNKGLIFGLGVLCGGVGAGLVANTILKQKYAQKADEEIHACSEAFLNELAKRREEANKKEAEEKKEEAQKASQKYGGDIAKASPAVENEDKSKKAPPYEISEEIYNDPANPYKSVGLTYFPADSILMREDGSFMEKEDIEATIGLAALDKFHDDDYDGESVIMRNEFFQCDYEINDPGIRYKEWKQRHCE